MSEGCLLFHPPATLRPAWYGVSFPISHSEFPGLKAACLFFFPPNLILFGGMCHTCTHGLLLARCSGWSYPLSAKRGFVQTRCCERQSWPCTRQAPEPLYYVSGFWALLFLFCVCEAHSLVKEVRLEKCEGRERKRDSCSGESTVKPSGGGVGQSLGGASEPCSSSQLVSW